LPRVGQSVSHSLAAAPAFTGGQVPAFTGGQVHATGQRRRRVADAATYPCVAGAASRSGGHQYVVLGDRKVAGGTY
jgi:hypothetical protein